MHPAFQIAASRAARLALGLILLGAAISKLLSLAPFFSSVEQLSGIPKQIAVPVGLCVLTAEFAAGLSLLTGYRAKQAAYLSVVLFATFASVLSRAIARGIDLPCNCFGVLGPVLPIRGEALLDLALCVVALHFGRSFHSTGSTEVQPLRITAPAAALVLLWGSALILWPHLHRMSAPDPAWTMLRTKLLRAAGPTPQGHGTVFLLADFDDFGCHLCLDDFLAFCDSLESSSSPERPVVRLIARRDSAMSEEDQFRMLRGWGAGNHYSFSLSIDREGLFDPGRSPRTALVALDPEGRVLSAARFPLGPDRREEILRAVCR